MRHDDRPGATGRLLLSWAGGGLATLALVTAAVLPGAVASGAIAASGATAASEATALPAAPVGAVSAWTSGSRASFTFASFHAEYELARAEDGASTLRAVETLVADFPETDENHGIERAIPRSYARVDLALRIVSVTDAAGRALEYTTYEDDYDDGYLVVRIGDADSYVHGRMSYVIGYTMRDVVRTFGDTDVDEFYWDINGTGTAQPYGRVSAELRLSPELRGTPTGAGTCYVGGYGDTTTCPIQIDGDGASVDVAEVDAYETVTWAIAFPRGTFRTPPLPSDSWIVRVVPWVLVAIALACAAIVAWLRLRVFRDEPGRGIVVPQYAGYPELGVMEAAVLLGREPRGLPAQFVQLVVTRAVRLVDRGKDHRAKARYRLELVDASGLDRDDAIAVATLFRGTRTGRGIELDTENRSLGDRIAALRSKVRLGVAERYRMRRTSPWTRIVRVALFLNGVAAIVVAFWAADADAGSALLVAQLVGVIAVGLIVFGFAGSPEVLTREGALAREHLDGIRDYLELAEADRIRVLQSAEGAERTPVDTGDADAVVRLHERLLPYAILFGIEESWQRELGTMYATTPSELAPTFAGVDFARFAAGYTAANFATTPPPTASSSSSSGSSSWSGSSGSSFSGGSSGGGFAGGGGGGGGAGGW